MCCPEAQADLVFQLNHHLLDSTAAQAFILNTDKAKADEPAYVLFNQLQEAVDKARALLDKEPGKEARAGGCRRCSALQAHTERLEEKPSL